MNARGVFKQVGLLLVVLSLVLFVMAFFFFGIEGVRGGSIDPTARTALLVSGAIGLVAGGVLWLSLRSAPAHLGRREALLLVAMSWIIGAAFSALPYFFWAHQGGGRPFTSFVDCYFEAMSGLTTTGASVLEHPEGLPRSLLLWRAITQWLGGLGIVVLFVAVLPSLGVGGKKLYRVEAPGPSAAGLQPHIRETARLLWVIYLGLTALEAVSLTIAGLSPFDAICHTFSSVATGGFSTRDASIAGFDSITVEVIIMVFMVLGGVNFGLYYQLMRGRLGSIWKDTELRFYLVLLVGAIIVVGASIVNHPVVTTGGDHQPSSVGTAVRYATFTTTSLHTGTGFAIADYVSWPFLAHAVLVVMMFVGGCAGSTAGGIKVIRVWVAFKVMWSEVERVFRPQVVRPVKIGNTAIDPTIKLGVIAYVLGIMILFAVGSGAIMLCESGRPTDFTTASTSSIATLCNIGPALGLAGPAGNYGFFSEGSKIVMCVLMAMGRLEVFAIIVLFTPRFWRGD